ncbi:putative membrane protein [Candidatus Phytoplasma solani]|uniref:hypothetical protein n=1 Tax=Candidatus Phytoplasma solani TaxID=69896 RepID=UPI0032DA9CED
MKIIGKIISIIVILIVFLLVGGYLWSKYDFWKEMKWCDEEKDNTKKNIVKVEQLKDDAKELLENKKQELASKEQEKKDKEKEKEDLEKKDKDVEDEIKVIKTKIDENQKIIDDPKTPPKVKQQLIDKNIDLRNQEAIKEKRRRAIKEKIIEIDARIAELNSEMALIQEEIKELETYITQLEKTLSQMRSYLTQLENYQEEVREREKRPWYDNLWRNTFKGIFNFGTGGYWAKEINNHLGVGTIKRPTDGIVCTPEQLTAQMQNIQEKRNQKSTLNKNIRTNKSKLVKNQTTQNKLNNLNVN